MKKRLLQIGFLLPFFSLLVVASYGQQTQLNIPGHGTVQLKIKYFNQVINHPSVSQLRIQAPASCSDDSIVLTRQSQVDSFPITNPTCTVLRKLIIDGTNASPAITRLDSLKYITQITQDLVITNTSITDLSSLLSLTQIGGALDLEYNPQMTSTGITGLTQLGSLILNDLPLLTSISGLSNNINYTGSINIDSTALTSLDGLENIDSLIAWNGGLNVSSSPLTSFSALTNLSIINGYININDLPQLTSIGISGLTSCWGFLFSNLPNLTSLGTLSYHLTSKSIGTFWFNNTGLNDLSGMDSVYSSSNFYIWFNPNITSLHGLEQLGYNNGIALWGNNNLSSITALSHVTAVTDGTLAVSGNDALTSLAGLENITNVDGGLFINDHPLITDLNILNSGLVIHNNNDDSVRIYNNPQLQACSVPALCNYFASQVGGAEIHDNAPGCNDAAEVAASCGNLNCTSQDLKTWNGSSGNDWNDDNNWTPFGVPQPCDSVLIPSDVSNYPQLNSNVIISGLKMDANSYLDQNGFNLSVFGNVIIISATIDGAPGSLLIKNAHNIIDVESSNIYPSLTVQDYICPLTFRENYFDNNVFISDLSTREGVNDFGGNTFNHLFSIVANATDNTSSQTYFVDGEDDNIKGDATFTVNSPVHFDIASDGNTLHVGGNLIVNSNYANIPEIRNGNIDFENGDSTDAHITKLGSSDLSLGYFNTNKISGSIILDQKVYIEHNAHFNWGLVKTDSSKLLIFKNGAKIDQYSSASYVQGPIKKIGNAQFSFPIGDSITSSVCTISAPALATDEFTAQYFHQNPSLNGYDTSLHESSLNNVSGKEYWKITRNNGNSNVNVTLFYDSTHSGPLSTIYSLRVAKWDDSLWLNSGASSVSGDTHQAFVTVLHPDSTNGIYTLGFAPTHTPVITIGQADTIGCVNHIIRIPFSVDTLMFTNNQFRAEISDSNGSFVNPTYMGYMISNHSDTLPVDIPYNLPPGNNYRMRIIGTIPGDTSTNHPVIKVLNPPSTSLTINGSSTGCIGVVFKYYVTPLEQGVTYNWSLTGGGTYTTNNDTIYITWTTTGNYIVSVNNSNACATGGVANKVVSVSPGTPTATPTLNNIGRWLYSSVPASNQNSLGYHWYRNDTLISGANNSSYYVTTAGNYTVKYYNLCGESPVSNTISFASNSLPQTITFPAIPDKTYGDSAFVPNATASSELPVTFTLISGPASLNPVTNLLTILGIGNITIKATQQGDNIYDTAAPVTRTFTVNKAPQTINFSTISDKDIFTTTSFSLSATASSGLPVSFSYVSGPATLNINTVTLTGLGTVTVRASQSGDTNYLAATNVDRSFCVTVSKLNPITGPNSICPATNATYFVNNISGAAYTWYVAGSGNLSSTTNTVTTQWPSPGNYTLIVSATGSCGAASNNDSLSIVALTTAQPDSVHGMLPADGAINQQLPLTLSWIPGNQNLNYTFDVYLWRSDSIQPGSPYTSNITTVNYTIPVSANLSYNHAYKWMVVAHNGSCTQINTGPIQQFSLIPLPDLQPLNVQAPTSAFSGQTVSINWTVKNNGPGSTGTKTWTDGIFFSFDSLPNFNIPPETSPGAWNQLQFPIRPLLIGTRPNVSSLDSGQQYSNSINFTLPLNYGVPLYVYVIANYPHATNSSLQTTYANDTARAAQPINVTLSPQPDLRVDTVFTPASTFTGSTINLTYKVKNYGVLTPSGGYWYDNVYISSSPFFDVNNAILLKFPKSNETYYYDALNAISGHFTQLQQDSSYTISTQVVIPNFLPAGSYYIYVFTNSTNTLYEGTNTTNNVGYNIMQVFLTPTPVLTISSLTIPTTTASTTQSIGINWNIKNTGFNDNMEKNKGHYGTHGSSCQYPVIVCDQNSQNCYVAGSVPGFIMNDSLGWGSSYWKDKIYLSRDSVSLNISNAIYIGPYLHGGDRNIAQALGYFNDGVSFPFNTCQLNSSNPGNSSMNTQNVINPGKDFPTSLNFTIPDTLSQGDYYVYVYANPEQEVFEYPGTAQIRRSSLPITVQRPDAIVNSITVPASATGGQPVNISYTVTNNGPGSVYNHVRNDKLYISTSSVFDNNAQAAGTFTFTENLPAGTGVQHTINYTFPPATSGVRYFYVQTNYDSSFKETNQNNNVSAAAAVSVTQGSPVDLIVSNITLADTVFSAYQQLFKYTVTNNGPATTTGNWTDSIFISCVATFNSSTAYFIAKRNHNGIISSGNNYKDSFYFTLPYSFHINNCFPQSQDANAYFSVKTNADNSVYEGANTGNNTTSSLKDLRNPFPDQIVTTVSGSDSAIVGRSYTISWTVKNQGYNPGYPNYSGWADFIFISPDSVLNGNATSVAGFSENNALNTNQTYTDIKSLTIPVLPTGDYYVLAYTNGNNGFFESNRANNINLIRDGVGAAKKIHITQPSLPDLTDSILSVNTSVALGQPLTVAHQVINRGTGITYPNTWADRIWLSPDFIPTDGVLLYQKTHTGNLSPNQYYNDTITTNPVPVNLVPGNYVLIAQANSNGNIAESNSNNNLAFYYITVYSPAPVDLLVESIQKPDSVYLGYTIDTAKWVVFNNSSNTAKGVTTDGIYLSHNTTLDSTAILIGLKNKNINMSPLSRDSISFNPLVTGVTEGNYNVLVKTDILNNILESDKNNNSNISATPIYVKVKPLPLNVLTSSTLQSIPRNFKLRIPDSLIGATIMVTLKSNDSLSVNNQMYIGDGYIPSAAHFDYEYNNPNYGNQQIILSSVTDSVYYITINCTTYKPPLQNITLKAEVLPFAIVSVDANSGGNSGNVTIRITGSLFTNSMTAELIKTGTTIIASSVYYTNSTTVYASFNLQGQPLGIYDVKLIKADSSTAVLPNGFSVVAPNNGGLITGGGVNTGTGDGNQPACDPGAAAGLNSQLSIELVLPNSAFGGWPFPIQINYNNPTNNDIPAQTRVLYSLNNLPVAFKQTDLNSAGTSLYLELTEQNGPPGIIRAGGSGTIIVYSRASVTYPAHSLAHYTIR